MKKTLLLFAFTLNFVVAEAQRVGFSEIKGFNINNVPLTSANILQYNSVVTKVNDSISIDDIITIPTIFQAAGDTSNYHTPGKVGNIFIDTSSSKIYISKSGARNGWVKLN